MNLCLQLYLKSCDVDNFSMTEYNHDFAIRRHKRRGVQGCIYKTAYHVKYDCEFNGQCFENVFIEVNKIVSEMKGDIIILNGTLEIVKNENK